jgi:ribosomal RNA-processing protein 8
MAKGGGGGGGLFKGNKEAGKKDKKKHGSGKKGGHKSVKMDAKAKFYTGKQGAGKKKYDGDAVADAAAQGERSKHGRQQQPQHEQQAKNAPAAGALIVNRKGGRKKVRADGDALLESFRQKLSGSTFRLLNEQLYTTPSAFAGQLLGDRETFDDYHAGYRNQLEMWPTNPATLVIDSLNEDRRGRFTSKEKNKAKHLPGHIPPGWIIGDFGCGDALIAETFKDRNVVQSFDLCAANDHVTVANLSELPIEAASIDIGVFCLALMSTNYYDFLVEAHRVVKPNKLLKVVEVRSRIPDPKRFVTLVEGIGFSVDWWGVVGDYFCAFDFIRNDAAEPNIYEPWDKADEVLLPCVYKRR